MFPREQLSYCACRYFLLRTTPLPWRITIAVHCVEAARTISMSLRMLQTLEVAVGATKVSPLGDRDDAAIVQIHCGDAPTNEQMLATVALRPREVSRMRSSTENREK